MATTGAAGRAGLVRVEQGAKRVRAYLGGQVVADTIQPRLLWEVPYYPANSKTKRRRSSPAHEGRRRWTPR